MTDLMTDKEVQELLKVSRYQLARLRADEGLPFFDLGSGKSRRYSREQVQGWLKQQQNA